MELTYTWKLTRLSAVVGVTLTASLAGAVFATPRFSVSGTYAGSNS